MTIYELCITSEPGVYFSTFENNRVMHGDKEIVYIGDARYYENVYDVEYADGSGEYLQHESELTLIPRNTGQ